MKARTPKAKAIGIDPWREPPAIRRVAAPFLPAEIHPVADARHAAWSRTHGHAHASTELLLAWRGAAVCGTDDGMIPVEPGTLLVFPPGSRHDEGYPSWTPDVDQLWIRVVPNRAFAHAVAVRGGRWQSLGPSRVLESGVTGIDLGRILEHLGGPQAPPSPALRRAALVGAATALLACLSADSPVAANRATHHADRIDAICRHLDETAGRGTTVEGLARLAGLSTFHFVRLFKQHKGQTVHAYVNRARQARLRELRARELPFKAIAQELGFSSPASFSRWRRSYPA